MKRERGQKREMLEIVFDGGKAVPGKPVGIGARQ